MSMELEITYGFLCQRSWKLPRDFYVNGAGNYLWISMLKELGIT